MIRERQRPRKRKENLIVRELRDEVLVYDLARHKALCLNQPATEVWERCDGKTTPHDMARALRLDERVVWCALRQLDKDRLLEAGLAMPPSVAGLTRREQIRALAKVGAVAIPLVTAVTAPTAAEAATCKPSGQACATSAQCCSGICSGSKCM